MPQNVVSFNAISCCETIRTPGVVSIVPFDVVVQPMPVCSHSIVFYIDLVFTFKGSVLN